MKITYDPVKRAVTLADRQLDFEDAAEVFRNNTLDFSRQSPGLWRAAHPHIGRLRGRMVIVVWTPRGNARHVFSMRKANAREKTRFGKRFEEG